MLKKRIEEGYKKEILKKFAHERNPAGGLTNQIKKGKKAEDPKLYGPAQMQVATVGGTKSQKLFPPPPAIEKKQYQPNTSTMSSRRPKTYFESI